MAELVWGEGPRNYDLGVDRGVLYFGDQAVPWNGLVRVTEEPSFSVEESYYFEGQKIAVVTKNGDYRATIEAFAYPRELGEYDGYSLKQASPRFGLAYRTQHGLGHQIHLVYNAAIDPQGLSWGTTTSTSDPSLFGWNLLATSQKIAGAAPASRLTIDSASMESVFRIVERALYGSPTTAPRLPSPEEIVQIYEEAMRVVVTHFPDGSYTIEGDDEFFVLNDDGSFTLDLPSALLLDSGLFQVGSYVDG